MFFSTLNCLCSRCQGHPFPQTAWLFIIRSVLAFTGKGRQRLQLGCLCLLPNSPSVKTLLLIIYWAVMKWQMIYWEPKPVFQWWTFLSFCVAACPVPCNCWGNKRMELAAEGPRTITHTCPHFTSWSIPVWFNSLLLLKNSICLIELLDSKNLNPMHFNHSYQISLCIVLVINRL